MGYKVLGRTEEIMKGYGARPGLEGPFVFPNYQVVYYDPREGKYWDPRTDFYLEADEAAALQNSLFDRLR